jgi:hypothetical protein
MGIVLAQERLGFLGFLGLLASVEKPMLLSGSEVHNGGQ